MEELDSCNLCPINCNVNRNKGELGRCKAGNTIKIGLYKLHYDEEPCISGVSGSGTVFFSNCNLKCCFCQNYKISCEEKGREITIEKLSEIFLELQSKGANNINLVTATPYVLHIIEAIKIAKSNGLSIPILYNSSGYEKIEIIKLLNGYIDIYLPDFKYYNDELAMRLSKVHNYKETAINCIKEMYNQVGENQYDERGILKRGIIIRHLVMPNNIQNSKDVLSWIKNNMPENITISLMAQYFPTYKAKEYNEINRKITKNEYEEIENYLYELDFKNGYIQDLGDNEELYVPDF